MTLHVLSTASEAYPLVKTGGLADVAGALPAALAAHGVRVTTLLPGYPAVVRALESGEELHRYADLLGVEARLVGGRAGGLDLVVLDAPALFDRQGGLYADEGGADWPDNWRRFAAFARAAADLASGVVAEFGVDVLHAHDWQAAMAPAYLRYGVGAGSRRVPPSVMTVHNLAFQGRFGAEIFSELGLPPHAFALDGVEYYGGVGFLKAGLQAAIAITTVSPTYAEEILTPEFGMGLEGLLQARRDRLVGIVNGIDTEVWNPQTDAALAARYTAGSLEARARNKEHVEAALGLEAGLGPLFCVVSRLSWQKGMDVLAEAADALVARGGRLALLGAGDPALEQAFLAAAARHPGRIGVRIGHDEALAHRLQGGADAILIPSRFEPCGLTQLYGLRYGCVPVVARTGGLADTVVDADPVALAAGAATGVLFAPVTPEGLIGAVERARELFRTPERWRALQRAGAGVDVSWARAGARYRELYGRVAGA